MKILVPGCAVKDKNKIYFVSNNINIIYSYDMDNNNVELVGCIPEENFLEETLVRKMLTWNEKFVLIPYNAKNIWIVDKSFSDWKKIELEEKGKNKKFCAGVIYGDFLYLFQHLYPHSLCVNLETFNIEIIDNFKDEFFTSSIISDGYVYCPSAASDKVFKMSLSDKKITCIKTNLNNKTFSDIKEINNKLYVFPRRGDSVCILDKDNIETLYLGNTSAVAGFLFDNKIYIASCIENTSYYIDKEKINKWDSQETYISGEHIAESIFYLVSSDGKVCIYDDVNKKCCEYKIEVENQKFNDYLCSLKRELKKDGCIKENHTFSLDTYISLLNSK